MKILRRVLVGLAVAIVLLGMFVAAAFNPTVQTWYAQSRLDARQGVRGSVGEVSAGLGNVEVTNLHLETSNAVIDVPSLQATLPVTQAAWKQNVQVRSLVAKGWTIDLTQTTEAPPAPTPAISGAASSPNAVAAQGEKAAAAEVEQLLRNILGGQVLPYDLSLDGVELEGDVLVAPAGRGTVRVHVTIKGGGLAAGHAGQFAFDCEAAGPWPGISMIAVQGQAVLTAKTSRRLDRVALQAEVATRSEMSRDNFNVQAQLEVERTATETSGRVQLSQGERHLATILIHGPDATGRWEGNWKVDLRTSDWAWLAEGQSRPAVVATGMGTFASDAALEKLQVRGKLATAVDHLGSIAPGFDRLGGVRLAAEFNLEHSGHDLRVDELTASLGAAGLAANLHLLQAFHVDEQTGQLQAADPHRDWLAGTFREFPLAWISDPSGRFALAGGNTTGDFVVRPTAGGFSLRPEKPVNVAGVSLQMLGRPLVSNLDLTLAWQADYDGAGWRVALQPLTLSRAGRRLGSLEAKVTRAAGTDSTVVVDGKWDADLTAIAALPEIPPEAGMTAQSATGEFTANVGPQSQVEAKLSVVGHDPKHTLTASLSANEEAEGRWRFQLPLKMTFGRQLTDFTAEGSWVGASAGGQNYVRLTGEKAELDHLRRLAHPLAVALGVPWPGRLLEAASEPSVAAGEVDRTPFWGGVEGTVVFDLGELQTGEKTYQNVGGSIALDHHSVQLTNVRGRLAQEHGQATPVLLDGQLNFDPESPMPYRLKASGNLGVVDASALVPAPKPLKSKRHEDETEEPLLEGRFSTAVTLSGSGRNLADLAARTQQEIKLTSQGGILRLLKVFIGDAFQEQPDSAVSEAVGGVGSLVGKIFAIKDSGGEKKVNPITEDVLDLASQLAEIEFESLVITAVRSADGTVRVVDLALTGPTEHLTGSGQFSGVKGWAYLAQPFTLELTLGGRGRTAELMAKAGLATGEKDSLGYTILNQTLRFGGTLEHIDSKAWHDLLVKALPKPAAAK